MRKFPLKDNTLTGKEALAVTLTSSTASPRLMANTATDENAVTRSILYLYIALAALYVVLAEQIATVPGATLKVLPIVILLGYSLRLRPPHYRALAAALVCGGCGDILMAFGSFIPGLSAFLVGHLLYIYLWLRRPHFDRAVRALPVLILTLGACAILLPYLGEIAIAVAIYMGIIGLMAASASISGLANSWGIAGVYSFMLSDFIIAWNRFVDPLPLAGVLIMCTYYFAQGAIAHSLLSSLSAVDND